jgi:hypothetical protein
LDRGLVTPLASRFNRGSLDRIGKRFGHPAKAFYFLWLEDLAMLDHCRRASNLIMSPSVSAACIIATPVLPMRSRSLRDPSQ